MKNFLMILVLLVVGCWGSSGQFTTSAGIDMETASCAKVATTEEFGTCYTPLGVYAELGKNPCVEKNPNSIYAYAWNPVTGGCVATGALTEYTNCTSPGKPLQSGDMVVVPEGPSYIYEGGSAGGEVGIVCLPCTNPVTSSGGYGVSGTGSTTPVLCDVYEPYNNQL